jgi:hypothetical protein
MISETSNIKEMLVCSRPPNVEYRSRTTGSESIRLFTGSDRRPMECADMTNMFCVNG